MDDMGGTPTPMNAGNRAHPAYAAGRDKRKRKVGGNQLVCRITPHSRLIHTAGRTAELLIQLLAPDALAACAWKLAGDFGRSSCLAKLG
jgi:hypothetical protein